jgi:hypothetical protein
MRTKSVRGVKLDMQFCYWNNIKHEAVEGVGYNVEGH